MPKSAFATVLPLLGLLLLARAASADAAAALPDWQPFSPHAFEETRRDNRLVIVDLTADWLFWLLATMAEDPARESHR